MDAEKKDLTAQQIKFVEEFVKDYNGSRAIMLAYNCTPDTASAAAAEILSIPTVQTAIADAETEKRLAGKVNQVDLIDRLQEFAACSAQDCFQDDADGRIRLKKLKDLPRTITSMSTSSNRHTGEQEIKLKIADPLRAVELLGKTIGLYKDMIQVEDNLTPDDAETKKRHLQFIEQRMKPSDTKA